MSIMNYPDAFASWAKLLFLEIYKSALVYPTFFWATFKVIKAFFLVELSGLFESLRATTISSKNLPFKCGAECNIMLLPWNFGTFPWAWLFSAKLPPPESVLIESHYIYTLLVVVVSPGSFNRYAETRGRQKGFPYEDDYCWETSHCLKACFPVVRAPKGNGIWEKIPLGVEVKVNLIC